MMAYTGFWFFKKIMPIHGRLALQHIKSQEAIITERMTLGKINLIQKDLKKEPPSATIDR